MKTLIVALVTIMIAAPFTYATQEGGNEGGNGGDVVAFEFREVGIQLADELREAVKIEEQANERAITLYVGADFPDKIAKLTETATMTSYHRVFNAAGEEKDALNFPEQNRIDISRSRWTERGYTLARRRKIVLHELCGLAKVEKNDDTVSTALLKRLHKVSALRKKIAERTDAELFATTDMQPPMAQLVIGGVDALSTKQGGGFRVKFTFDPHAIGSNGGKRDGELVTGVQGEADFTLARDDQGFPIVSGLKFRFRLVALRINLIKSDRSRLDVQLGMANFSAFSELSVGEKSSLGFGVITPQVLGHYRITPRTYAWGKFLANLIGVGVIDRVNIKAGDIKSSAASWMPDLAAEVGIMIKGKYRVFLREDFRLLTDECQKDEAPCLVNGIETDRQYFTRSTSTLGTSMGIGRGFFVYGDARFELLDVTGRNDETVVHDTNKATQVMLGLGKDW